MSEEANFDNIKSIKDFFKLNFFVPNYQRGYRWEKDQITDLLEDILEFNQNSDELNNFYCLQPLVVKMMGSDEVEGNNLKTNGCWYKVVDGQQRLTTILILLKYLNSKYPYYYIEYERDKDKVFSNLIEKITSDINPFKEKSDQSIDLHFASEAYDSIQKWFTDKENKEKLIYEFLNIFYPDRKNQNKFVGFIWYKIDEETDEIEVFKRLNVGKIQLTDSELIKALFLNSSNFSGDESIIKLRKLEIANSWDNIEAKLHDELFWGFIIGNNYYNSPTRIDFIFNLICDTNKFGLKDLSAIGNDKHRCFRYFYIYFKEKVDTFDKLQETWDKVKSYFNIFNEWFDDLEIYHYAGFLLNENAKKLDELMNEWINNIDKLSFVSKLKTIIWDYIKGRGLGNTISEILNYSYECSKHKKKTECKPILLLHNIQTIINQSKNSVKTYGVYDFYRFPFSVFRRELWDVEHIDSATTNELRSNKDKENWLKYATLDDGVKNDENILNQIKDCLRNKNFEKFESISEEIEQKIGFNKVNNTEFLCDEEKNKIWNYVLLDSSTNRGYGNALFPIKRKCIIGKDQGKKIEVKFIDDNFKEEFLDSDSSFIPICTKYAFLKYYNTASASIMYWDKNDAKAYKENIKSVLYDFLGDKNNE